MIKPEKLNRRDTIALISPSSSLATIFPRRLNRAVEFLKRNGYHVKLGKTVFLNKEGKAGTIEERVQDIHEQFRDSNVKAIVATAGGLYCNELLNSLDYSLVHNNPKIFCGYSDNTFLSAAFLSKADLISFYGPCALTEFGEYPKPFAYTWNNFKKALEGRIGKVIAAKAGTDEFVDWTLPIEKKRLLARKHGYMWLNKGNAVGKLIGGCLPSLTQLNGTEYDFNYQNAILFLEIPEGETLGKGISPEKIEIMLTNLELSGKFDNLEGLILGRLFRQSEESEKKIKDIFYNKFEPFNIPLLYGIDITHADPQVTIPIGVMVEMDSANNVFKVLEQGVV